MRKHLPPNILKFIGIIYLSAMAVLILVLVYRVSARISTGTPRITLTEVRETFHALSLPKTIIVEDYGAVAIDQPNARIVKENCYDGKCLELSFDSGPLRFRGEFDTRFEWSTRHIAFWVLPGQTWSGGFILALVEEDGDEWEYFVQIEPKDDGWQRIVAEYQHMKLASRVSQGDGERLQYIIGYRIESSRVRGRRTKGTLWIDSMHVQNPARYYSEDDQPVYPERYFAHGPTRLMKPDYYQLLDGNVIRFARPTEVRTNTDGFRDYNYLIEKPENTFRILALGDSFTFGFGVELEETYVKRLEKALNDQTTALRYEVINLGVPGANVREAIEVYRLKGQKYSPDLITLGYMHSNLREPRRYMKIADKLRENYPSDEFRKDPRKAETEILRQANDLYHKEYSEQMYHYERLTHQEQALLFENQLHDLYEMTKLDQQEVLLFSFWETPEWQNEAMRAVADKYGWAFLELNWMLDKYKRSELTVHRRDCHPNAFANELVSKAIMETFMQERLLSDSLAEQ